MKYFRLVRQVVLKEKQSRVLVLGDFNLLNIVWNLDECGTYYLPQNFASHTESEYFPTVTQFLEKCGCQIQRRINETFRNWQTPFTWWEWKLPSNSQENKEIYVTYLVILWSSHPSRFQSDLIPDYSTEPLIMSYLDDVQTTPYTLQLCGSNSCP